MGSSNGQLGSVCGLFAFVPGSHAGSVWALGIVAGSVSAWKGARWRGTAGVSASFVAAVVSAYLVAWLDRVKATSQTVRQPASGSARAVPLFPLYAAVAVFTWLNSSEGRASAHDVTTKSPNMVAL